MEAFLFIVLTSVFLAFVLIMSICRKIYLKEKHREESADDHDNRVMVQEIYASKD